MSATAAESVPVAASPHAARWRPSIRGWSVRIGILLVLGAAAGYGLTRLSPVDAGERVAVAAIYAIIGLSLNIVMGYTGQVSLGHHAFVGIGAFASAYYVTETAGCTLEACSLGAFFTGVGVAVVIGALSAGLLGLVALRIKGLYLSLITLTFGFVAVNSIFEIPFLTRGGAGMPAPRPERFSSDHEYMFLCLVFLAICLFIDWRLVSSKVGRAILAVKQSEPVAASYAVNVTFYKVFAFMFSGAFAGLAGALFAHRRGIVVSNDFTFQIALLWVLMVVVGGLGKRGGVVIGSAFFALFTFIITKIGPLTHFIEDTLHRNAEQFTLILGPLLALLTLIQFPGGIAEQISPITRWFSGEKFSMHPDGKKPKQHKGLGHLLKRGKGPEAPAAAVASPATSPELVGSSAASDGASSDSTAGSPSEDDEGGAEGDTAVLHLQGGDAPASSNEPGRDA